MGFDFAAAGPPGQDPQFLSITVHGVAEVLDLMLRIGMAHEFDPGDSPDPCDYGLPVPAREVHPFLIGDQGYPKGAVSNFLDAYAKWLEAHDATRAGIAAHKLKTNDEWYVTAGECKTALEVWESAGCPTPDGMSGDYWLRWIEYVRFAARNYGFEVS